MRLLDCYNHGYNSIEAAVNVLLLIGLCLVGQLQFHGRHYYSIGMHCARRCCNHSITIMFTSYGARPLYGRNACVAYVGYVQSSGRSGAVTVFQRTRVLC